jgi:nucleoid-associated protein YgaU
VSVPNAGKLPVEGMADATGSGGGAGADGQGGSSPIRDARAHAAKDADFELESPRSQGTSSASGQNAARIAAAAAGAGLAAGTGTAIAAAARPTSTSGRVDSVPHVVEKNENFWTISRLYYSSGRYYRALWKANAEQFPDIRKLKVNDVINIPAVEDLDPTYIDPPRSRAPTHLTGASRNPGAVARGGSPDRSSEPADSPLSSSVAPRDEAFLTARTNRAGNDGVPVKRSSRSDADLDLPPSDTISRRSPAPDRTGRPVDRPLGDDTQADDPPSSRTSARSGATSPRRPAYKVRQFDTLRSIARDMLGDSHRGSEILDLNRDLIDDPAHLTVGQVIELPDDARTSVRRTRRDP